MTVEIRKALSRQWYKKMLMWCKFSQNYIQGVTRPHRQNDRDDRPCREDNFLWRNMYSQTCRLWVMRRWRCSPVMVGIEYKQLYTYFIEKGILFHIVAATIGQQGRATGPPRRIHCCSCCCPQRKNEGALNQALRIATTEWGLTAQIIISSTYNNYCSAWFNAPLFNRWSVGSSAWRAHLDTCA